MLCVKVLFVKKLYCTQHSRNMQNLLTDQKNKKTYSEKMEEKMEKDVFIFCHYMDNWLPRAVIADISKFGETERSEMELLLKLGNIVETVEECKVINKNCRSYNLIGFRAYDSDVIISGEEITTIVHTWQYYADGLHKIYFPGEEIPKDNWIFTSSDYYINDENSNLSPFDLYDKLKSLTYNPNYPEDKFVVKHCVLVSDVPLNKPKKINSLRFFVDKTPEDIESQLANYFDVKDISLSSEKYGYLRPKTIKQWKELSNSEHQIGDINLIFA